MRVWCGRLREPQAPHTHVLDTRGSRNGATSRAERAATVVKKKPLGQGRGETTTIAMGARTGHNQTPMYAQHGMNGHATGGGASERWPAHTNHDNIATPPGTRRRCGGDRLHDRDPRRSGAGRLHGSAAPPCRTAREHDPAARHRCTLKPEPEHHRRLAPARAAAARPPPLDAPAPILGMRSSLPESELEHGRRPAPAWTATARPPPG